MDFDEPRIGQQRPRRGDRRVEAFGVADRERRAGAAAAAIISSASASERAIGFSTSTGTPRRRNGSAISRCSSVGTAIVTASTCAEHVAVVEQRRACRSPAAISSARARFVSTTATSSTPGSDERIRA